MASFALPPRGLRQKKIRHVSAGHQQEKADCTQEEEQSGADMSRHGVLQTLRCCVGHVDVLTVLLFQATSDRCEFGASLRQSDAVLHAAEDMPIVRCTAFIIWRIDFAGHPEVSVIREAEPLRHYPDDRKNLVIGGKLELREIF
jgi:hypothetical protein